MRALITLLCCVSCSDTPPSMSQKQGHKRLLDLYIYMGLSCLPNADMCWERNAWLAGSSDSNDEALCIQGREAT